MELIVVSGLSGGGKSTALRALEDIGIYCVDNLPVPLVPKLVEVVAAADETRTIAVGLDAREKQFLSGWGRAHEALTAAGHSVDVLFVEASQAVLVGRYSSTRRLHPMGHLPEAIDRERELLAP
ncbi:MAG: RNase adapter RapZ, partial [Myxococcota bacterium]